MLVSAGLLRREQLEEALAALEATPGARLRDELIRRGWVTPEVLDRATEASLQSPPSSPGAGPASAEPAAPPTAPTIALAPTSPTVGPPTAPTVADPARTESLHPDPDRQKEEEGRYPPEVTQAAAQPKNRFGKYILVRQLGHGGMAVVYKAWDTFLNHFVALKFIKTQDIADGASPAAQEQIEQFMAEARLAVKLNHPNIARVYELGKHEDKFYMAQYYIDGPTLHEVIHGTRSKSLDTLFYEDPRRYVKIMRDLADAMAYAHSLTPPIIHRDLKPSNVLLDSAGRAYVVDFGLAKELRVDGGSMSGSVKGTPKYMAPEQAEGRSQDMDGRTDVWALGVILYEMLTGRAPFEDENIHRLLSKIVNEDPPWPRHVVSSRTARISPSTQGVLSIPRDVEMIAMKCLQKDRRHRYAGARELVADLDRVILGQEVSAPDRSIVWFVGRLRRWGRRYRWGLLAGAALAALALGLGLRSGRAPGPDRAAPGPAVEVPEGRRLEVVKIRDAFLADPTPATLRPLADLLERIEPVLAPTARQGLGDWWVGFVSPREAEASSLYGSGKPQKAWLTEPVRRRARALLADFEFAAAVNRHHKALGLSERDLAGPTASLRAVLAWKGHFTLAANVHPWASVRVRIDGKDYSGDASRQEDVTPVRYAELPVGGVRLEFVRGAETRTVEVGASELRDGSVLRVWGPWEKLERSIE
jgi:serine/threonine protein kinase